MVNPILTVWRTIVRHARHIPDPAVSTDLRRVKHIVRKNRARGRPGHVRALFGVEAELRKVCSGTQTLAKARGRFQSAADKHARRKQEIALPYNERNQEASKQLWIQHESRRFDTYNAPPRAGSAAWRAVDRRSRVSNATANFLHAHTPANSPAPALTRNAAVDTVFAEFWREQRRARTKKHEPVAGPRLVDLVTVNRVGGTLSLLRVRGVRSRGRGLRRFIDAVSKDTLQPLKQANFDLWLAREYACDPLGDPDMDEWIEAVRAWKRDIETRHREQDMTLEVRRRILIRRRETMERNWAWQYRRDRQTQDRQARLGRNTPPLLRLDTL